MDETTGSAHDLLLAVAGRVDDDLLAWARELVAVGEDARAVELVTAGLAADGTALPTALRARLVDAARTARIDLDADAALPTADDDPGPAHRFTSTPAEGDHQVADAVRALPARLLQGAEVLLTWRSTPAGAAPGPLPHPVVLVEIERGGRPADVLAYQLSVALDRAGVVASVEVLTSGNPLSPYHAAARRESLLIESQGIELQGIESQGIGGSVAATSTVDRAVPEPQLEPKPRPEPVEAEAREPAPHVGEYAGLWSSEPTFVVPAEPDATATEPAGEVAVGRTPAPRPLPMRSSRNTEPEPRPAPRPFERRRTTVTPLTRSSLPGPVPLVRRDGSRLRPLTPVADETPALDGMGVEATDPRLPGRPDGGRDTYSSLADTPTFRSMQDPLSGPLNAPLLAPLLDPTADHEGAPDTDDDDPFGLHGISPLAPDNLAPGILAPDNLAPDNLAADILATDNLVAAPAPVEDRWAGEWASGDWAVSSSDLDRDPEPEPVAPHPEPEEHDDAPRHRFASEKPPARSSRAPSHVARAPAPLPLESRPERPAAGPPRPGPGRLVARPVAAQRPEPAGEVPVANGPAAGSGDLGLRPDSVARLSEADRDLLARLQSELGAGPRARMSRRAGVASPNGTTPHRNGNGNGSGHGDPPDLAG